jgi:hypothetical protein
VAITPSLEWDAYVEGLEEQLLGGIQRLSQDQQRKSSGTTPNLLEDQKILVVSTDVSSLESFVVDESLDQVFEAASSVKSIVMTSDDMDKDRKELGELIAQAEDKMDLNPVEFMQVGNVERMNKFQDVLDGYYENCAQKFRVWQDEYATVLDTTVEADLKSKMTKLKQDLLAYKRSALAKQASLPAAVPQPSSAAGQGDQLAKNLKQDAKGKMMALYNKLKSNCDGIKGDASVDELGTVWEDAEDDDLRKAMKDKERWISRTIRTSGSAFH